MAIETIGFLPGGGGGGLPHGITPPPCEVLPWDFFRGKLCHMVFLHGERLPYGIISGGGGEGICHGICSHIKKCVCVGGGGEIYHRGGRSTIIMVLLWYCFSPGDVLPCDLFWG